MTRTCGNCRDFSIKDCPEQAAQGIGKCLGEWEPGISPFRRWDEKFCVLWGRAPANPGRDRWLREQADKQGAEGSP